MLIERAFGPGGINTMSKSTKSLNLNVTALILGFLFSFASQAQSTTHPNDFFKPTKTTVEELPVSASEYQEIIKVMNGNFHISCQPEDLNNAFATGSASPLAPNVNATGSLSPLDPFVDAAKDVNAIVDEGEKITDGLINIGQKIWSIIKAGQAVVNINIGPSANALPKDVKCWDELENWKIPNVFRNVVKIENIYGYTLSEFQFDLIYTHGGTFNGTGKYLTHVQIFPSNVYAFWMQELNASVEIASLVNMGTTANPIAGMQVDVSWQFKNFLNEIQQSTSLFVTADGKAQVLVQ